MTQPTELDFVTCEFGRKGDWMAGYHTGIDYRAPEGTPIFATRRGKVVHSGWGGSGNAYGNHVTIQSWHRFRFIRHMYAHLSFSQVKVGDRVIAGEEIGKSGTTGNVSGPHLHYEERVSPFGYWNHIKPVLPQWQPKSKEVVARIMKRITGK
jgi:murein DD-endopeptidase MepM/ murein hydrolase activator NlpD